MSNELADLVDTDKSLDELAYAESQLGYLHFLKYVVVNAVPKNTFLEIADPWQWEREERSAPAIDNLAGITDHYAGPLSFWHGYAKGHDKTHAIARKLCFLLGWSKRRLHLYACAGDRDQAALVTMAMKDVLADNEWIAERVDVATFGANGASGSELTVLSMDAWTGQGIFPDYLVAEEITHWMYDDGREFWDFILSSMAKRPHAIMEVCTNAGHIGSWQHQERLRIGGDPSKGTSGSKFWSFYEQPQHHQLAGWMNAEKIADDSAGMDRGEVRRLFGNEWIDPGEERGYLTLAEAMACVDHNRVEAIHGDPRYKYFAVVDYGTGMVERNRDRCALCVMHAIPGTDLVVIDRLDCWEEHEPGQRIRIDIDPRRPDERSVEGWIRMTRQNFRPLNALVLDPFQMESMAQKFERENLRVERFEFRAGKKNMRMAQLLRVMVQNQKVTWSPEAGMLPGADDDTFAKELSRLVKKPMVYGYKFDHESGRHDDRTCCVGMGLVYLVDEIMPGGSVGPKTINRPSQQVEVPGVMSPRQVPSRVAAVSRWGLNGIR